MLAIDAVGVRRVIEEDGTIRIEAGIIFSSTAIVEKGTPEDLLLRHERELRLRIMDTIYGDIKHFSHKLYTDIAEVLGNTSVNRWVKITSAFNSFWNAFDYLRIDPNCKAAKYPRAILEMLYYDREITSEQFHRLMDEVIADGKR